MKSQDVFLLLKLVSLELLHADSQRAGLAVADEHGFAKASWQDWEPEAQTDSGPDWSASLSDDNFGRQWMDSQYTVRGLQDSTGISKTEVAAALKRCQEVGLVMSDRHTQWPVVNRKGLWEFLVHGLRYVFPAKAGALTRGIATGVGAPVLQGQLMSAGDLLPVWPDARGNTKGLSVAPLFKSVPHAARRDPRLYALLALTDAVRMGRPREHALAAKALAQWLELA